MSDLKERLRLVFGVDQEVCIEAADALDQAEKVIEELAGALIYCKTRWAGNTSTGVNNALTTYKAWKEGK